MSLNVSFGAYSGTCSTFNQWRNKVAVTLGFQLVSQPMPYGPDREVVNLPWDTFAEDNYIGQWAQPPADAALYLLVHSDCEGVLQKGYIPQLYLRLEVAYKALLPLSDTDPLRFFGMGAATLTKRFMDGINKALEAGADLEFH